MSNIETLKQELAALENEKAKQEQKQSTSTSKTEDAEEDKIDEIQRLVDEILMDLEQQP
jgi:uncharacterized protein YydD (DUF2326 family)